MLDQLHTLLHSMFEPLTKTLEALGLGVPELSTIMFILGVCISLPWINIFRKAGYGSAKGLLMLIPVVNFFVFFRFAFGVWPIEQKLRNLDPSATWREF